MTAPLQIDLSKAVMAYAAANSPLFLLKRLRADPTIENAARERSERDIFSTLKERENKAPTSINEEILPYVFLVMLSYKGDADYLRLASRLSFPNLAWYGYMAKVLLQGKTPNSSSKITVNSATFGTKTTFSNIATTFLKIE